METRTSELCRIVRLERRRKKIKIGGQSFDFAEHVISMTSLHANCTKTKKKEKFIIYDIVNRVGIDRYLKKRLDECLQRDIISSFCTYHFNDVFHSCKLLDRSENSFVSSHECR